MSHGCRKSCHFTNIRPIANRPARCVGYSDRTNSLTDLIQQPCGALHRRAAGFMVEFSTAYLHSMHTAKLGFKPLADFSVPIRSEEHTSELQSQSTFACRLLLEKKNQPP